MIYWLRIIFVTLLSLFVLQGISEDVASACNTNICTGNILSTNNEKNLSFEESSSDNYLIRTINHILKSRYADLSIPVCIIYSSSKDNNDNKSILPLIGGVQKNNSINNLYRFESGCYSNSQNLIHSPKDYYIYTLEKIII